MKRYKVNLKYVGILSLLGFLGALSMTIRRSKSPTSDTLPSSQPYAQRITGIGVVEPKEKVLHLAFQQKGVVEKIQVVPGQRVIKGQVLCVLNQDEIDARISTLEAVCKGARIQEKKIKERSQIAGKLYKEKVFSSHEARWNAYNAQQALVKLEECTSQVRQAKIEKERHLLRAPSDGTILSSNLHLGQYIIPGSEVLIMGNLSKLRVCVEFDEMYAGHLKNISRALGRTKSFAPETVRLELSTVDPYVYPKRNLPAIHAGVDSRVFRIYYDVVSHDVRPNLKDLIVGQELDVFVETPNIRH